MAIEIEKRFLLNEDSESKLIDGAEFLGEKILVDIYYDNPKYELTTKDFWLRNRNGIWELKVPLQAFEDRSTERYTELETEQEILGALALSSDGTLAERLLDVGIVPFATIKSTRQKYKHGQFGIDLDITDFGYKIAEIELMVEKIDEAQEAEDQILKFAEGRGLPLHNIHGKLIAFLQSRPEHLKALMDAGVVQ